MSGGIGPVIWLSLRLLRAEGWSRGAPGVGDAEGTRRPVSPVSWPISVGIGPVILFS